MKNKLIVVEGYLASGKSTFALKLAEALKIPYFMKDTFKIALCEHLAVDSRRESSRFSTATFDAMIYAARRLLEAGYPVILEGNFVPQGVKDMDESGVIRKLIAQYACDVLDFKFWGDTKVLYRRFLEREKTPQRGKVNTVGFEPSYAQFDTWCHNLDPFEAGGSVVKVDTTDFSRVDFPALTETARRFLDWDGEASQRFE